jgi:hypothetical protein
MEDAIAFAVEMNEWVWKRFVADLQDVTSEEAEWRPLPEANNINLIVRHLRVEAQWQLDAMAEGKPMPAELTESDQKAIDSIPLDDFAGNFKEFEKSCTGFIEALHRTSLAGLEEKGETAYQEYRLAGASPTTRMLGFHHAVHLAGHLSQIHTIRNLYRKTRGEPARFFPDNPTFPRT